MTPPRPTPTFDPGIDASLVARCQNGDPRAWQALVRRHERLVYSVARAWRLSDEDTGDVFQEVFAALVRSLPRLRDGHALVRWISTTSDRIARTTALRRRREQAMQVQDETALDRQAGPDEPVGADLERLERQATVRLALEAISERCRRLLQALYYEDPPPAYADLAKRLGVPVGSLGPTRARCMEKLAQLLDAPATPRISNPQAATSEGNPERPSRDRRGRPARDVPPPAENTR